MKLFRKIAIAILSAAVLVMGTLGLVACNNSGNSGDSSTPDKPTVPSEHIVNGSFENNADESTWTGWTKGGTAFSARGVISGSEVNGVNVDKTGDKFFSGLDGGTQKMTGTLKSDVFEVIGTGKIAFKMGAAKHGDKIYVQFFEENSETALATVTNTDFDGTWITDQLVRKIVDLSEHIGKKIYILVTDEDNNDDYGYVNLDDFVMCLTEDDVATYEEERAAQLVRFGEPTFDEDETSNYIQNPGFETGDLTGWKLMEGTAITNANVRPTTQYYWTDRSVYGNGDYYLDGNDNGGIIESLTGSIRSSKFTLGGDGYIAFKLGSGSGNCYVAICDGETDEELIRQKNTSFSDPKTALMLLRYYVDASRYLGRVLYVKIVDGNSGGGFAFINADDFHVSMTEAEVRALQVADYSAAKNETYTGVTYNDIPTLRDYYENYRYLFPLDALQFTQRAENVILQLSDDAYNLNDYIANVKATVGSTEVTDIAITKVTYGDTVVTTGFNSFVFTDEGSYTVTYTATYNSDVIEETFIVLVRAGSYNVINGDFETGDLTGWTPSENWGKDDGGKYTGVDSAGTYWAEEAPFNKQGTYFVNGWNNGIEENATWTLRSSTFLLGGSGWITVRMAGNAAAVRVYTEDGTLVGYYKQTRFKDSGFADLTKGSWADMAVYAIDLSAYIGEKLYVELCDENVTSGGWKHAWFDDVNTYYEEIPDWENNYDEVVNGGQAAVSADEKVKVRINWVYAVNAIIANGNFETGDLTGWTPLTEGWTKSEGKYDGVISDQTWWAEQMPYNKSGVYHLDGWNNGLGEADTWAVRSSTFKLLGSGWITVRMGGAAAAVKVYQENGTLIGYYKQTRYNNVNFPHVGTEGGSWADMAVYAINLSTYVGQNLYIELCDEPATDWAHAFFDDVVTYYPVAPDYANNYDEVIDGGQAAVSADEKVKVRINWVLAQNRLQVMNGSFEQGNLTGWTPVTEGWQQDVNGNYVGVKRASTYGGDDQLPYNQTGSYLLEGTSTGFEEAQTWTVRSSTFTLLGSGWITVKMGGNAAAVKVYKANGVLIGYYKQTRFNDDQDKYPHVGEEGGSWADMAVYAIDLSAYIGEDLYIELCDEEVGEGEYGWAFFDDAIVYYATAPDWENNYNSVNDGGQKGVSNKNKVKVQIKWVLAHNSLDD